MVSLGLLPLPCLILPMTPPPLLDPGSLTEVRVDLVVRAGSGLGFQAEVQT